MPSVQYGPCRASLVLHSRAANTGIELVTIHARYPRIIHAEAKTHRVISGFNGAFLETVEQDVSVMEAEDISRNGRSSRAVPVTRLLEEAKDPFVPVFMKNQPGMSASEYFDDETLQEIQQRWRDEAERTRQFVEWMHQKGVHKQWANRPLEWFGYIDTLITMDSTAWPNFFGLRDHEGAQPEIQFLARAMRQLIEGTDHLIQVLEPGQWHLPYVSDMEWAKYLEPPSSITHDMALVDLQKLSVARCARLSIKPFDGNDSLEAEFARYDKLVGSHPVHASPAEHQATPDRKVGPDDIEPRPRWQHGWQHGNFTGWRQFRKMIPGERITS